MKKSTTTKVLGALTALVLAPNLALAETTTLTERYGSGWATYVAVDVPHGLYSQVTSPTCMNDVSRAKSIIADSLAKKAVTSAVSYWAGPYADLINAYIPDVQVRGTLQEILNPSGGADAYCALVAVIIPTHATNVRVVPQGADNYDYQGCGWDMECIPYSRWNKYTVAKSSAGIVITAQFMNWSNDRTRQARLKVLYNMPAGETPRGTR